MGKEALAVFEITDRLSKLRDVADIWSEFMRIATHAGFNYGVAFPRRGPGDLVRDTHIAVSLPEGWLQYCVDQNYDDIDPLSEHALTKHMPFLLEDVLQKGLPRRQMLAIQDTANNGMPNFFVIPHYARGAASMVYITGENLNPDPHDCALLHFGAIHMMARILDLQEQQNGHAAPPILSRRERECLQWVAAGKSDWEIGGILSLSEKTVNEYVERAKQKFSVATRAQAIVLALTYGAIRV